MNNVVHSDESGFSSLYYIVNMWKYLLHSLNFVLIFNSLLVVTSVYLSLPALSGLNIFICEHLKEPAYAL